MAGAGQAGLHQSGSEKCEDVAALEFGALTAPDKPCAASAGRSDNSNQPGLVILVVQPDGSPAVAFLLAHGSVRCCSALACLCKIGEAIEVGPRVATGLGIWLPYSSLLSLLCDMRLHQIRYVVPWQCLLFAQSTLGWHMSARVAEIARNGWLCQLSAADTWVR